MANPFMPQGTYHGEPTPPVINIQSPSDKLTYWVESDVWFDFTANWPVTAWYSPGAHQCDFGSYGNLTNVEFSVDGLPYQNATRVSDYKNVGAYSSYSTDLGLLSGGQHIITVTATGSGESGVVNVTPDYEHSTRNYTAESKLVSSSISRTILVAADKPLTAPSISLITPKNQTYIAIMGWKSISYVHLQYIAIDTRLSAGFSIDGSGVTPIENGTSLDLALGSHRLTLYANDSFGNSASPQTVYFQVVPFVSSTDLAPYPPRVILEQYQQQPPT